MSFADNLKSLPSIDHLLALELLDDAGSVVARIENKPGKAGSLAVYHALAKKHGVLDQNAAREAIDLFAEHVEDARANPGKHPNIDRLFELLQSGSSYSMRLINQ